MLNNSGAMFSRQPFPFRLPFPFSVPFPLRASLIAARSYSLSYPISLFLPFFSQQIFVPCKTRNGHTREVRALEEHAVMSKAFVGFPQSPSAPPDLMQVANVTVHVGSHALDHRPHAVHRCK